jgi:hypothetical protein
LEASASNDAASKGNWVASAVRQSMFAGMSDFDRA